MKRSEALEYRKKIEAAAKLQNDDMAVESAWMYPRFEAGMTISGGDRVRYEGALYRCIAPEGEPICLSPDWTPANAPSLFAKLLPGQEGTSIGEWEQPDSTNPYRAGERVMHNGVLWISEMDDNVWEPGVYGWQSA